MADNPYTPPTLTGYNLNPPPNDGSTSAANKLDWTAVHLAKLGDPLKNYGDDQNSATLSAFGSTINTGNDQNNAMGGSLAFTSSEVTIATFTITPTRSHHTVDTEGDAATDELQTMNTGSVSDGAVVFLRAENSGRTVTVKHGVGNIFLYGQADIVLSTGNSLPLMRVGSEWREPIAGAGKLVQKVVTELDTYQSTTSIIPLDDTLPQITEGTELMTRTITPRDQKNRLLVTITVPINSSGAGWVLALFQDAIANALSADSGTNPSSARMNRVTFLYEMEAGTTNEITFRVRYGRDAAGTVYVNGNSTGRLLGGAYKSYITVEEFQTG